MNTTIDIQGDRMVVALHGRLDASSAPAVEAQLVTDGIRELVLDFADCPFVSSCGIRTVLVAHRRMANAGGRMVARSLPPAVREIFDMTGLSSIISIARPTREISIDGLELLSQGVCGECFRLDAETVVKLYREGVAPEVAEQEKRYAKAAFVMGIPTAISYDVVSCGTRSGIVFELLNAELFSSVIRRDPGSIDLHARRLSDIAKLLHAGKGDRAILTDLKDRFRGYIRQIDDVLTPEETEHMLDRLEAVPDADTCVHFDLHSSNIMVQGGELVIIDMGDFSIGSNMFDLGLIYMIYGVPELGMCRMATKIETEDGLAFWNAFARHYFSGRSAEERAFFEANRYFLASLRIVHAITYLTHLRADLARMLRDVLMPKVMAARAARTA
jgi:anti-anti-sigma factor